MSRRSSRDLEIYCVDFDRCPTNQLMRVLGQKWAPVILNILASGSRRYSELRGEIPSATQKMLTQTLRQLESNELICRHVTGTKPPLAAEYGLSPTGKTLAPVLGELAAWANANLKASASGYASEDQPDRTSAG
jgi:DNA-binding HxlR family transcriptional regulator